MSIHVMSWVLRESEAKLGDRLVLLVLADHAKDDGTSAWPSVDTIGREARLTRRQVQRCLRNLELADEITATGKTRMGTVVYSVNGFVRGRQYDAPGATSTTSEGATNRAEGGVVVTPEPSLEQPSELQSSAHRAREILKTWNELAGQTLRSEVWVRRIMACVKLYPELTLEEHTWIISASLSRPWWSGKPTPAVIYGTTAQFERTLQGVADNEIRATRSENHRERFRRMLRPESEAA